MSKKIAIDLDEIIRAYRLLAEVNHFIHQPMNYDKIEQFAKKYHQEIADVYYDVIREWIPDDVREKLNEE